MSSDKARGWTPEEVIRLRQMVADYATAPELAAAFDRTTSAIYQKLSSLGLKIKRRPEPEPHEWGGTHEIKPRVTVEQAVPRRLRCPNCKTPRANQGIDRRHRPLFWTASLTDCGRSRWSWSMTPNHPGVGASSGRSRRSSVFYGTRRKKMIDTRSTVRWTTSAGS